MIMILTTTLTTKGISIFNQFRYKNKAELKEKNLDHHIISKLIVKVKFKVIMNIKGHSLKVNIHDRFFKMGHPVLTSTPIFHKLCNISNAMDILIIFHKLQFIPRKKSLDLKIVLTPN